jgi:hypothetical protein
VPGEGSSAVPSCETDTAATRPVEEGAVVVVFARFRECASEGLEARSGGAIDHSGRNPRDNRRDCRCRNIASSPPKKHRPVEQAGGSEGAHVSGSCREGCRVDLHAWAGLRVDDRKSGTCMQMDANGPERKERKERKRGRGDGREGFHALDHDCRRDSYVAVKLEVGGGVWFSAGVTGCSVMQCRDAVVV